MTGRIRRAAVALCVLSAFALPAVADSEPVDWINLYFGAVSELPATPLESGDVFRLDVEVKADGQGALEEDPLVELSLRRQDKPEACITELALVPAAELADDGSHVVSFRIDTVGLSGGDYEVVATITWDGVEPSMLDNRKALGFVRIADPRPELHPVGLSTDPAIPLQWEETGMLHTTIANTGRLAAGPFHVVFELRPNALLPLDGVPSRSDASGDGAEEQSSTCGWIRIASRLVPGLARNEETRVSAALDVAAVLGTAVDACNQLNVENLREYAVTFDVNVRVEYPAPGAEEPVGELDPSNNAISGSWKVVPSELGKPDLVPLYVTFDEDLPLNWDDAMTAMVVVANVGGRAFESEFSVRFSYRALGDTEWESVGPDTDDDGRADDRRIAPPLPIEVGANETAIGVTIDPQGISPSGMVLEPGSYELKVEIDTRQGGSGSTRLERNELNNTLIVGFSVRGTELQAEGLELPSSAIHQGDSLIVKSWIVNTGDRPAKDFAVGFYLNDARFDTFVYSDKDGLQEDERTQVQGVLDTRDLPPAGYDLRVIVDPDDRIPEYDEGNNIVSMPILVRPPVGRLAELHVTELRLDPPSPISHGLDVTCRLSLRNVGEIDTEDFKLLLEISRPIDKGQTWTPYSPLMNVSGAPVRVLIPGLERGEATTIQAVFSTAVLSESPYRLRVVVDPEDEITETDDSNNTTVVLFTIGRPTLPLPLPDGNRPNLTLSALSIDPTDPCDDPVVTVRGTVLNEGGASSSGFTIAYRWIDPLGNQYAFGVEHVDGLAPGQSSPFARTVDATSYPPGLHRMFITLDPDDRVQETDETDNQGQIDVRICDGATVLADLVAIALRFDSPDAPLGGGNAVEPGQRLYAYVTVRNSGVIPSGPFAVAFTTPAGTETEAWASLGPQDQVEVSHPVPTMVAGVIELTVAVDPDDLIEESNETDNDLMGQYRVLDSTIAPIPVVSGGGAAQWLAADDAVDIVYAAWTGGTIRRIKIGGTQDVQTIADLETGITAVAWETGPSPKAFVGTTQRTVVAVDLSDESAAPMIATFSEPIVDLCLHGDGRVFVVLASGFAVVSFAGEAPTTSRVVAVPGTVFGCAVDASRETVYIASSAGVYAYGALDLALRCSVDANELAGVPTAFAHGATGIVIGTSAGVVYAMSHCTSVGGDTALILEGWRHPAIGSLGGAVLSIVIDPRDIDPIYVTASPGWLYSLGFNGTLQWSAEASAPISSMPLAETRSGRVCFGDEDGRPYVLALDGTPAFDIDQTGYVAGAVRSMFVIVETREKVEFGTRFVRSYVYGTADGVVYKIASQR